MCNSRSMLGLGGSKKNREKIAIGGPLTKDAPRGGALAQAAFSKIFKRKDPTQGTFGAYTNSFDQKTALGG